ncbi:DUF421 domain-containing protein [Gorillibacterium sp. sgz5001074]|uniref:DUF421 domain-containing protein n=1 Tax=Gorillibacterium sp. sgz5001074 TaxID=3446695 RepID=UPI003F675059
MDISWGLVWKCAVTVLIGITLMRLSGRKSIAQMTVSTTVIMISIGELLSMGIIEHRIWRSAAAVALFLITLVLLEWLELKFTVVQKWLSGDPVVVIRDGQADERMLQKMRITYHQLNMRLRQKGISSLSEVRVGTIEMNGELGFELYPHAKPLTAGELENLLVRYNLLPARPNPDPADHSQPQPDAQPEQNNGAHA